MGGGGAKYPIVRLFLGLTGRRNFFSATLPTYILLTSPRIFSHHTEYLPWSRYIYVWYMFFTSKPHSKSWPFIFISASLPQKAIFFLVADFFLFSNLLSSLTTIVVPSQLVIVSRYCLFFFFYHLFIYLNLNFFGEMDVCSMHYIPILLVGWGIKVKSVWRRKRRHEIVFQHPSFPPSPPMFFWIESALAQFFFSFLCTSWTLIPGLSPMPKPIPIPMKIHLHRALGHSFCLVSPTEATLSAVFSVSLFSH